MGVYLNFNMYSYYLSYCVYVQGHTRNYQIFHLEKYTNTHKYH